MKLIKKIIESKFSLPVIVLAGLAFSLFMIKSQPEMAHTPSQRPSVPVNFIQVEQHQLKPEIIGFGTVQPDLDLQAKAEVTGSIVYIHPALKKGEIFAKDTLLLKIDDKDYLLQLKQAEADLLANQANLTEKELSIDNNRLELTLAREKLKGRQQEYARKQTLSKSGSISQSSLGAEKQNLLQQKQEVQLLINKQTTLPSQLKVMQAKLEIARAKLQKSQRDLTRTQVKMPFNGRISQVHTELDQYIATGAPLFDAFGLKKIIINAQFPVDQFSLFAKNFDREKLNFSRAKEIPSMAKILTSLQLTAKVEEAGGEFKSWTGKAERFSDNLDPKSRTVGVIISVEDSYREMQPGSRPPLLQGMYMKVTLQGAVAKFIALPRFALHEGQVYQVTAENQLKRVALTNLQFQGSLVLLNSTLKAGDKIITSDVFPAVDGMSVSPMVDNSSQAQMKRWLGAAQ